MCAAKSNLDDDILDELCRDDSATQTELNKLYEHGTQYVRQKAAEIAKDALLYLYSRFKYVTEGPCNTDRPSGMFNFEAKSKWDSWNALSKEPNFTKDTARQQYISKLDQVVGADWRNGYVPNQDSAKPAGKETFGIRISCMAKEEELEESEKTCFDLCKEGNLKKLKEYFSIVNKNELGLALDQVDDNQMTLLMWACDHGHLDIVRYLGEMGAGLNLQDVDGQTCLHYAVSCGHLDIVRFLLGTNRIDKEICDGEGLKAVDSTENEEIVKLLA